VSENPYASPASANEYAPTKRVGRHYNLVRAIVCLPTGIVISYFGFCYAAHFGVSRCYFPAWKAISEFGESPLLQHPPQTRPRTKVAGNGLRGENDGGGSPMKYSLRSLP
jgi:hypothetical protein